MKYIPVIGLEIHFELNTKTKMFCSCLNTEATLPNSNVCPICLGHPGTLPTINPEAVEKVIKVGLATNCQISDFSFFERKNYFYPDLPKGYQISQYTYPLCQNGYLVFSSNSDLSKLVKIRINRIHLEEDTAKSVHFESYSLIDFNRAGIPLAELVTEPEIKTPRQAKLFAQELQKILRYLEVSNADMEKGQMRVEANVSLISPNSKELGTKVEIKNLNSFRAVEDGLNYEIERQSQLLNRGEKVIQETRGWDAKQQKTFPQRSKEYAPDYKYFPEPDLIPIKVSQVLDLKRIKKTIPELPRQKLTRFQKQYQLTAKQANQLVGDKQVADFFEQAASKTKNYQLLFNYFTTDLMGLIEKKKVDLSEIDPEYLSQLINLLEAKKIRSPQAKAILSLMVETKKSPQQIIEQEKIGLISDLEELTQIVEKVIANNSKAVEDFKKGKLTALQYLIGQTMKETKGQVDPQQIKKILQEKLT